MSIFKFCTLFVLLNSQVVLYSQSPEIPSGRRLRTIVEERFPDSSFLLGATTGAWTFGKLTSIIMDREFNYVTPENDFKQWNIHPDNSGGFNWTQTDAWMKHIRENNQILRMHCPIGPQCSSWTKDDSRTAEELTTNLNDFMTAVCRRYNDSARVFSLDVVNEVVKGGAWHGPKSGTSDWENPWTIIGSDNDANKTPLYIKMAFKLANEYAPDLKLIFNHHEHPESTNSWNLIKQTVQYLRDSSLRVDGIGWQAHVDNGWATESNLNHLRNLIDWAHNNDLEFHVTEASVWIKSTPTNADFELQAETYRKIIEVLIEKNTNGKVGWNIWHIDDGTGWHTEWYPSLFDSNGNAKPAYYSIQSLLEGKATDMDEREDISFIDEFMVYPNPVNSETHLHFNLSENSCLKIEIFNSYGQLIAVIPNETFTAGTYHLSLNTENYLKQGLHLLRITSGDLVKTIKLMSGF